MNRMKEMVRVMDFIMRESGPMADDQWKAVWTEIEALLQQIATLELRGRHIAVHHNAAIRSLQSKHNYQMAQLLKLVELAQYGSSAGKEHIVDYQLDCMSEDLNKAITK